MASGKFSKPRNRHQEEPVISQAFEEYRMPSEPVQEVPVSPELQEDLAIEQAFLEVSGADEEPESDLPPFLENLLNFISKNRKVVLVSACAVTLVLLIGIIAIVWIGTTSDPYDGLILNNVTIAGVNVGGMTRSEAEDAVHAATDNTFTKLDMVIELPDTTLYLSPANTGAELDVKAAVKAAYNYGRTGTQAEQREAYEKSFTGNHTIGLLPYLGLNEEYIWSVLNDYASQFGSIFTETTYELQGEMPALETDKFDETAPCQTLVITIGTPGLNVNTYGLYNSILDAYSFNIFLVVGEGVGAETVPEPLDLEAVYKEICLEPISASVDSQTFEPIPGVYGYGFDMEEARKLLEGAEYGDIIEIPMEYIEPEILEDSVLFRDVLGECQTPHGDNENRTNNLRVACATLNGLVLEPGETFSYNDTLGKRTEEAGYLPAPAYSGNELVDSIGGGICQVSSTLYYCSLLSDMEIVSRVNHGYAVSYIDLGMDATVNWGGPDFQFRNNTNYPIKIEAEVSGGYVKMRILGTDEKDYYVKMEYEVVGSILPNTTYSEYGPDEGYTDGQVLYAGVTGSNVKTYRCKYSKETDKLISRDFETRSTYNARDKLVVKIVGEETVPTDPTTPSTEPSGGTTEATTPSTEATTPSTEATAPTTGGDTSGGSTEITPPVSGDTSGAGEAPVDGDT